MVACAKLKLDRLMNLTVSLKPQLKVKLTGLGQRHLLLYNCKICGS